MPCPLSKLCLALLCSITFHLHLGWSHEHTLPAATQRQQQDQARLADQAARDAEANQEAGVCRLTLELIDSSTKQRVAGNVKITDDRSGKALALTELISRPNEWFSMPGQVVLQLTRAELTVTAFRGIDTPIVSQKIDLRDKATFSQKLMLPKLYDAEARKLVSGNTHLHLNRISRKEADRYLRVVPQADDIDLLYVSHLERAIDDEGYITNEYDPESLKELSNDQVTLRYGEEHRHNFGAFEEGYGHVMFLDIQRLIQPVSIGPGITQQGTDGIPLRQGIDEARQQGASVIWCHNKFGIEDLPSWLSGVLHAQNIFDGGDHGSYDASYYRYLNIGMKVPFSTGTDWFVYDLSRVFVPLSEPKSSPAWLRELAAGRSYITNGTFLEFSAAGHSIGDSIKLTKPGKVQLVGRGIGRHDFAGLELVHNGKVIHTTKSSLREGRYESSLQFSLQVENPGWVALRIPLTAPQNEFQQTLFAHSSPIYLEFDGKHVFSREVAQDILIEMERNVRVIETKAVFGNTSEREAVLRVHREAIADLRKRLQANATN